MPINFGRTLALPDDGGEKYAIAHVVGAAIVIAAASNGLTNAPK